MRPFVAAVDVEQSRSPGRQSEVRRPTGRLPSLRTGRLLQLRLRVPASVSHDPSDADPPDPPRLHYWARDRVLDAVSQLTPEQFTQRSGSSFKSVATRSRIYSPWAGTSAGKGLSPALRRSSSLYRWTSLDAGVAGIDRESRGRSSRDPSGRRGSPGLGKISAFSPCGWRSTRLRSASATPHSAE